MTLEVQSIPHKSQVPFEALGKLFQDLGVESSLEKDSLPSCTMIFLGIPLNTIDMTMLVTPDRLNNLLHECQAVLTLHQITKARLQSLLGVMSFVTACARPARIFMSPLLNLMHNSQQAKLLPQTVILYVTSMPVCYHIPSFSCYINLVYFLFTFKFSSCSIHIQIFFFAHFKVIYVC